jgi:hypothetical protein
MDRAARIGFLAKGVVYALIGWFALRLALGDGGRLLGVEDASREVKAQPFGDVLLVVLAAGLACHATWLGITAVSGHHGSRGVERLGRRLGAAGGALMAGFLAVTAVQMVGDRSPGGRSLLHALVRSDPGAIIALAIGLGVVGAGLYQLYQAFTSRFRDELDVYRVSPETRRWLTPVGRLALAARGIVLPVAGWLLVRAGLDASARRGSGTGAALRTIATSDWGPYLLTFVAVGLVAYGVFMGVTARYGRMVP